MSRAEWLGRAAATVGALAVGGILAAGGMAALPGSPQTTGSRGDSTAPSGGTDSPRDSGTGGPTVVAIGDSIMDGHGVGAKDAWPELLARAQGWRLTDLASDGSGFVTVGDNGGTFVDQANVAEQMSPAIVIVSASSNDLGQSDADVADATAGVLHDLRTALPTAEIIAVSSAWGSTPLPDQLTQFNAALSDASTSIGGVYVDIGQPLLDHPELMQDDDTHPNIDGQNLLAATVEQQLVADQNPVAHAGDGP